MARRVVPPPVGLDFDQYAGEEMPSDSSDKQLAEEPLGDRRCLVLKEGPRKPLQLSLREQILYIRSAKKILPVNRKDNSCVFAAEE